MTSSSVKKSFFFSFSKQNIIL